MVEGRLKKSGIIAANVCTVGLEAV
jgi:hypothetical protein